jgi:IS605 OrfB family transposase
MPRKRDPDAPRVVYRTARCGLNSTRHQRDRLFGLLRSAGDVWCCTLELNAWRRRRQDAPLASCQELFRELTASGPGTFGELDVDGARSVLRRYSTAWFAAAKRRKAGDLAARYPRRRRGLVPVLWYHGTFSLDGRILRIPVARGRPPLIVRLNRDVPYPAGQVRSIALGYADGAEHRQHLRDRKGRSRATAARAPKRGQRGSRRWREHRLHERDAQARHTRRIRQAQHEAAQEVIVWAVDHKIGTLITGDPRGVLSLKAGRHHNKRTRDWQVGRLITVLRDKAEAAGITVRLVDERGTSSTCPSCARRVPKPAGRVFRCPHCGQGGHRDLVAAASIAARGPGGGTIPAIPTGAGITHRRAGRHLPGVHPARRDPRRRPPSRPPATGHLAGTGPPRTSTSGDARGVARGNARSPQTARQPPGN